MKLFHVQHTVEQHYKEKMINLFGHLTTPGKQVQDDDIRSLMFGDYMAGKDEERLYDEISEMDTLREVGLHLIRGYFLSL